MSRSPSTGVENWLSSCDIYVKQVGVEPPVPLTETPVVAVTGPRQSGKTTICQQVFPDKPYVSLEPLDNREYATKDPRGFLQEYSNGAILDEVQQAQGLLSYLQEEVDRKAEPGRFILTGSQDFGLSEAISQSLAGRIAILYLLPPSLDELLRFNRPIDDLWTLLWTGSFPRIYDRNLTPDRWLADYATTYIQRDVRQVLNVEDLSTFTTFLQLIAGRTANELSLSTVGTDAGITHPTVRSWISVLEASFICFRLPAWHRSQRKQAIKTPKIHFIDTGLVCYLLGILEPGQLRHHPLRGAIFETWAVSEIYKSYAHRGIPPNLFHFRDAKGFEIDLIRETGSSLTAVEIKSGATVASDFFRQLKKMRNWLDDRASHLSYEPRIIYGGESGQNRSDATVIAWRHLHDLLWN